MQSCKEVKEKCPYCVPGFYLLEFKGGQYEFFCNLTSYGANYPTCNGIKDYCPTCKTGAYIFGTPDGGGIQAFCNMAARPNGGGVGDGSCEGIKELWPESTSGFYPFEILGQLTTVYCERETAGGE